MIDFELGASALVPNPITSTNYISSSVAEPDATRLMGDGTTGEVAWNAATAYTRDQRVIRTTTHRTYRRISAGTTATAPENDPLTWFDEGPTNKWAWADALASSRTITASPANFVVRPGTSPNVEIYGLRNVDTVQVEMWDAPGGNLVYDETFLTDEYPGSDLHWQLYFIAPVQGRSVSITDLPVFPNGEIRVTLSSYNGQPVEVGLIAFGSYEYLGLAQFDFQAIHRSNSFSETDRWGNTTRIPGAKGKDLRGSALVDIEDANGVDATLEALLDKGAVYVVSQKVEHRFLKTWGVIRPSTVTAAGPNHAFVSLDIEGNA